MVEACARMIQRHAVRCEFAPRHRKPP
jgi:hypothetical protein